MTQQQREELQAIIDRDRADGRRPEITIHYVMRLLAGADADVEIREDIAGGTITIAFR